MEEPEEAGEWAWAVPMACWAHSGSGKWVDHSGQLLGPKSVAEGTDTEVELEAVAAIGKAVAAAGAVAEPVAVQTAVGTAAAAVAAAVVAGEAAAADTAAEVAAVGDIAVAAATVVAPVADQPCEAVTAAAPCSHYNLPEKDFLEQTSSVHLMCQHKTTARSVRTFLVPSQVTLSVESPEQGSGPGLASVPFRAVVAAADALAVLGAAVVRIQDWRSRPVEVRIGLELGAPAGAEPVSEHAPLPTYRSRFHYECSEKTPCCGNWSRPAGR